MIKVYLLYFWDCQIITVYAFLEWWSKYIYCTSGTVRLLRSTPFLKLMVKVYLLYFWDCQIITVYAFLKLMVKVYLLYCWDCQIITVYAFLEWWSKYIYCTSGTVRLLRSTPFWNDGQSISTVLLGLSDYYGLRLSGMMVKVYLLYFWDCQIITVYAFLEWWSKYIYCTSGTVRLLRSTPFWNDGQSISTVLLGLSDYYGLRLSEIDGQSISTVLLGLSDDKGLRLSGIDGRSTTTVLLGLSVDKGLRLFWNWWSKYFYCTSRTARWLRYTSMSFLTLMVKVYLLYFWGCRMIKVYAFSLSECQNTVIV